VKVLDFGIAKLIGVTGPVDTPRLTGTGQMIGTPAYMSPERLRGEVHDGSADVYSLGVMIYELVTGKPPFWSWTGNPWEIVRAHLDQEPPSLLALVPEAPAELGALVQRCLAKDSAARPHAAEVTLALREILSTLPGGEASTVAAAGLRPTPTPLRFPTPQTVRTPVRTPETTVDSDDDPVR